MAAYLGNGKISDLREQCLHHIKLLVWFPGCIGLSPLCPWQRHRTPDWLQGNCPCNRFSVW